MLAYSFIYSPPNYDYLLVGLFLILLLGLSWSAMFVRIMHVMTEQMVKSVDTLVQEIRFIRKEDPDHIIEIDTGDEIEEIAHQVNKMVRSIQELSQRNIALAEVNNRMEMQNLQARSIPTLFITRWTISAILSRRTPSEPSSSSGGLSASCATASTTQSTMSP